MLVKYLHTAVPDRGPSNVRSEVMSSTVIAVNWEEVPAINQHGNITMYDVLYEPLETFDGRLTPSTINTTDFEVVIVNLAPYVSYNISVRAYTVVGAGPYSEPISNRTLEEGTPHCGSFVMETTNKSLSHFTFHCSSQCCPWQHRY